ncbi:hypothetical protein [Planktothrix agardhii]|nr:hypothetical protein [Planktothrix agardhii]
MVGDAKTGDSSTISSMVGDAKIGDSSTISSMVGDAKPEILLQFLQW